MTRGSKIYDRLLSARTNTSSVAVTAVLPQNECTGCSACVNVCPVNALSLQPDKYGYYRSTLDAKKCINCGLCAQICPALKLPEKNNSAQPDCYAFWVADDSLLAKSSNGGVFSLLANEAFRRNGAVAGAAWKNDFTAVEHIIIDNPANLYKLQKSKYLQSYIGTVDREVKKRLDAGQFVLFSGCPCQIAGLKAYLRKDYDNLLLVDLLCGNAPSSGFFKRYLDDEFPDGITDYSFREKSTGWNADTITVTTKGGTTMIRRGGSQDSYQSLYHNHTMTPVHCEKCKYQAAPRFGDITIGDFWGIGKHEPKLSNPKGTSVVLCNNEKGRAFFAKLPDSEIGMKRKVPLDWLGGNGYMIKNVHNYASPVRDKFYDIVSFMPFREAADFALNHAKNSNFRYAMGLSPLHYDVSQLHFRYDRDMWEEHFISGATVLTTKQQNPPAGNYACLKLIRALDKGRKYRFSIRFKIKTTSPVINFHVKRADKKQIQLIYSHKISPQNAQRWVDISVDFTANSGLYNEFMIGATQIMGEGRFLAIDYIDISEEKNPMYSAN